MSVHFVLYILEALVLRFLFRHWQELITIGTELYINKDVYLTHIKPPNIPDNILSLLGEVRDSHKESDKRHESYSEMDHALWCLIHHIPHGKFHKRVLLLNRRLGLGHFLLVLALSHHLDSGYLQDSYCCGFCWHWPYVLNVGLLPGYRLSKRPGCDKTNHDGLSRVGNFSDTTYC